MFNTLKCGKFMQTIDVKLPLCQYPIIIGCGSDFSSQIKQTFGILLEKRDLFLISDSHVAPLYLEKTKEELKELGTNKLTTSIMTAGERYKNLQTLESFFHIAAQNHLDRKSVIAALGGGVVGDTAGFLAATWQRGIRFLQIPTSLLAMVDSSVGGKVAVDLPEAKNMIGAFHQPIAVIANLETLKTLPQREWKCGFAEIVKYGMILDKDFFTYLEQHIQELKDHHLPTLEIVVARCCELKRDVVVQDEKEQGLREILNYGHTFGHALETLCGYEVLNHGEGVAIGMMMAGKLACLQGLFGTEMLQRQNALLHQLDLDFIPQQVRDLTPDQITQTMLMDKKTRQGQLRFVLPSSIGSCQTIEHISTDLVQQAIQQILTH